MGCKNTFFPRMSQSFFQQIDSFDTIFLSIATDALQNHLKHIPLYSIHLQENKLAKLKYQTHLHTKVAKIKPQTYPRQWRHYSSGQPTKQLLKMVKQGLKANYIYAQAKKNRDFILFLSQFGVPSRLNNAIV